MNSLGALCGRIQACLCWQELKLMSPWTPTQQDVLASQGLQVWSEATEVGLVYVNQVDSSHGLAGRSRDQGKPLGLGWELALPGSLPAHNVECWLPHQHPRADFSSGEEVMEKANQAMERSYRASKNLLWSVCWCLADNTLKVYLRPKKSLIQPWCWFSNRISANSATLGETKWKKSQL